MTEPTWCPIETDSNAADLHVLPAFRIDNRERACEDDSMEATTNHEESIMDMPVITESMVHYGNPRVWVEQYETTDRHGDRCLVTGFLLNGPAWPESTGFKFKKNGERSSRYYADLGAAVPANVRARLTELQADLDAQTAVSA